MKITFALPVAGLSGGVRVVATYAERLTQRGHDVTLVSVPKRPLNIKQKIRYFLKEKKWPSHKHEPSHFDGINVKHFILDKCRPIAEKDVPDADIIIATWWETAEWIKNFSPSKGEKIYFVQHYETHKGQPLDRVRETYKLPLHKITISKWLLDILTHEYGDTNVSLVPNSIDHNFFQAPLRNKQRTPTVCFMYSNAYYKGCDITIEALKRVTSELPSNGLKIMAFGACRPSRDLPLPPGTDYVFQPQQNKIREIYSTSDFYLFSSRVEGFGLPLLESMGCRTPIIATSAGIAPELVAKGGGILLENFTPEAMQEAILAGLKMSKEEWSTMSLKAYNSTLSYTWADATELFEKALLTVFKGKDN